MEFSVMVRRAFSFLESVGYRCIEGTLNQLRYEAARTIVTIEWDSHSGELNLYIGLQSRGGGPQDAYSLTDILAMENVDVPERRMPFQIAEESGLDPFIKKLAEDTQTYAQAALTGDRMFFRRLKAFRNTQAQVYMRDMKISQIRDKAEDAWRERHLDKIINLYTSIEKHLSKLERAKLDYARKHRLL